MSTSAQAIGKVRFADLIEFVAVAKYHSFARAAAQLGVSPPALRRAIEAVEHRLGARLLNRTMRNVVPTASGERLLQKLRPLLGDLESALEGFNDASRSDIILSQYRPASSASGVAYDVAERRAS